MKVADLYNASGDKPIFSLEVFPPRNGEPLDMVFHTVEKLKKFNPGFVSVTCCALGSPRGGTIPIAAEIKRRFGLESVVHFICTGRSKQDIENLLMDVWYSGIENVLALRGDPPAGQKKFIPHPQGHKYASEVVKQIKLMNEGKYLTSKEGQFREGKSTNFCIGVGAYPEGHPECQDKEQDLRNLKIKVNAGADYIVTQMFLEADHYLKFVERAKRIGIKIPIIPGVMPLAEYSQVDFVLKQLGIKIPKDFRRKLEECKSSQEDVKNICFDHTLSICQKILENGAPGIQFFTMDNPERTSELLKELK